MTSTVHHKEFKPVVLDFCAAWCQPEMLMTPVLQDIKGKIGDRASILTVDIDKNPHYAAMYGVESVPTVIILHEGKVVWKKSGIVPAHEILEHLQLILA